ncbi:hypothetical protein SAMN04488029_3838 [Reichenbachiella faecimaris]|uniref:Uncharacterized protein n=1 Tax=Reichenbachiella faecimaris TaxID=692418 RepID=A0A1W2GQU7_REIFA|nr:hypothetical protein [Reichenbachiella faecimaris]SMD38626.1 hypothetical protein SAMN04488029_3838 [Reichenbachiella faecimaris]
MYMAFIFFVFLLLLFTALWRTTFAEDKKIKIFGHLIETIGSAFIGILIVAYFLNKILPVGDWIINFGQDEILAGDYTYGVICVITGAIIKLISSLDLD